MREHLESLETREITRASNGFTSFRQKSGTEEESSKAVVLTPIWLHKLVKQHPCILENYPGATQHCLLWTRPTFCDTVQNKNVVSVHKKNVVTVQNKNVVTVHNKNVVGSTSLGCARDTQRIPTARCNIVFWKPRPSSLQRCSVSNCYTEIYSVWCLNASGYLFR